MGSWVGYSAEGPGRLAKRKPDLRAPPLFRQTLRPFEGEDNSGTSAACGVAAGVVVAARLRKTWEDLPPEALRTPLQTSATPQGTDRTTRSRFGAGILNATAVAKLWSGSRDGGHALAGSALLQRIVGLDRLHHLLRRGRLPDHQPTGGAEQAKPEDRQGGDPAEAPLRAHVRQGRRLRSAQHVDFAHLHCSVQ
ncbi:hypothetical protein ACFQS7_01940 [Dankookia sp. GCM10030260]|uniref:hypothetical protein n=1 Tax=Dankookia sp. GCM10030260 TaxID=3273390 RepID=UPI00360C2919